MQQSILIASLPRSLSSHVYYAIQQATGLKSPQWTTAGEILNNDRHVLYGGDRDESGLKFLRRRHAPDIFHQILAFLDACTQTQGYIYKDVVHPFVIANWKSRHLFYVLTIERPLTDIAYSVLKKGWIYPGHAVSRSSTTTEQILEGLIRADHCLKNIPAKKLIFDEFIHDENSISVALEGYGHHEAVHYLSDEFCRQRDLILKRRLSAEYREIADQLRTVKNAMDQ